VSIDHIFRAYDIRGVFNEDLTEETMYKIGKAFATFIKRNGGKHISLGGDIRSSTPQLMTIFANGVQDVGLSIDKIEKSPLGITLFQSFKRGYKASAFITASHLPPEWNGIKFYWGEGIGFSPEENEKIKQIFDEEDFDIVEEFTTISIVDPYQEYLDYLKTKFEFAVNSKYKIAIDCGNGATSLVVPMLFKDLGFEVVSIFDTPDSTFPNRPSEPTVESLQHLAKLVKEENAHFGAGFDGDGDRCVFSDEKGNIISSDAFGIIVARYFLETQDKKDIIINMECSKMMEDSLKEYGGKVHRIRVGHSFLSLDAKNYNAIWGVEASGHAVAPEVFLFDDALILPLLLTKAIDYFNKSISELVTEVKLPITKRFDIKCPDDVKFQLVDKITKELKENYDNVNDLDGVAVTKPEGRVLIRVSNTSPKIRLSIEAMDEKSFDQLKEEFFKYTEF
jgi:phosphomannomutase / phosphoglucomutase